MELTTEQYQRISQFLDANMTLEEMNAFTKELAANPAMRSQLDFEQHIRDGFSFKKELEDKNQESKFQEVNSLMGKEETNKSQESKVAAPIKRLNAKWLAIAASVLIAVCSIIFFISRKSSQPAIVIHSNDTINKKITNPTEVIVAKQNDSSKAALFALLYNEYFKKDTIPETYPMFLAEAFVNYEKGNYTYLQNLDLENIPQTRGIDPVNSKENILLLGHYYKGIALMETNYNRLAIISFNWIVENTTNELLVNKAKWYMALAYLKLKNKEKATLLLKEVLSNASLGSQSMKLLEKINKL